MEPMTLGSPSHDSPQKPTYLPGFLMGDRAQSPISNVSISAMSPLRANRSHTSDVHSTLIMRNFHHELSDKPYVYYDNKIQNSKLIWFFFRSSTPILGSRVNEEPTKAPTIDLFDMLNASDYREEP